MESIPTEIFSIIASFLDDKSRRTVRLANTLWFNKIRCNNFKVYFTTSEQVSQIADRLSKYNFPLELEFSHQKFELREPECEEIGRITQLKRLIVTPSKSEDLPTEELHPLTNLTNLEVAGQYRDTQLPPQIIRHLTKLKELYIETKEQFEELDLSSFSNLEGLHFSATINPADPLSIVPYPQRLIRMSISDAALSKADTNKLQLFSNLKDLRIFEEYGSTNPIEPLAIPHLPNLEKLALLVPTGSISPLNTKLTFLCVNEIAKKGNLRELSNLKVLEMHWVGSSKLDLLTNLESLRLLGEDEKNINDTLRSVSATLTALEMQSAYFELPSITKLRNLQSLDFSMVQGDFPLNVISSLASTLTQLKLQTIPQEEFPTLASFTKLKVLEVFRNNFGGLFPIYKLINLESLTSDGSSYLRAEDIQRLSNLTYLLVNNILLTALQR